MSCYIVSYDLRKPGRNYDSLYSAIKTYTKWARINESVWAVVTPQSAVQIRDYLGQFMDSNDRLFVVKSGVEAAWRQSICKNEWLKENL
jgi:CRISPR/Cas system-associated endoribonuclease Cas2